MMHAAYITYILYQNEPSRPEPVELEAGCLREQLLTLFNEFSPDSDPAEVLIEEGSRFHGDVRIHAGDETLIYLSFCEADRAEAFEELGLDLKKLAG
jgi:hypothetical protein